MRRDDAVCDVASVTHLDYDDRVLTIGWSDGRVSTFHHLWLRDNCPQLRHTTTGHRVVETSTIPRDVRPSVVACSSPATIAITWAHDGHISTFDTDWLRDHDYSNGVRRARRSPTLWDATSVDALPRASYPDVCGDLAARRSLMIGFRDYGIALLHEVPTTPGTVLDVAAMFGEVRVTSWGRVFDVVSVDNANSVAYTTLPLVAHTDEAYRDPAPTIQLQHFLRTDAAGGAATLVDGFMVAADLAEARPDLYHLLATVPLHFHFRDDTSEHEHDATVLDVDGSEQLRAVRFSNHSAQPFLIDPQLMERYYEAYTMFGQMRESATCRLQLDLQAGDLYIIDNRRVLHGRTGFSGGGARHLQSCYIERDEFISRLAMLDRQLGCEQR